MVYHAAPLDVNVASMDYQGWELWRTAEGVFCAFRMYFPGDPPVPLSSRIIRAPTADARDRLIRAWEDAHKT